MRDLRQVTIRKLNPDNVSEFIALLRVFEQVFEVKDFVLPDTQNLHELLKRDNFMVFIADHEGEVVGGLTTYILASYYYEKPLGYIFDFAVESRLQRRGIGKKILQTTLNYCNKQGFEGVFVQADKEDDHALHFYRQTKPSEELDVNHFFYTFKK